MVDEEVRAPQHGRATRAGRGAPAAAEAAEEGQPEGEEDCRDEGATSGRTGQGRQGRRGDLLRPGEGQGGEATYRAAGWWCRRGVQKG